MKCCTGAWTWLDSLLLTQAAGKGDLQCQMSLQGKFFETNSKKMKSVERKVALNQEMIIYFLMKRQ